MVLAMKIERQANAANITRAVKYQYGSPSRSNLHSFTYTYTDTYIKQTRSKKIYSLVHHHDQQVVPSSRLEHQVADLSAQAHRVELWHMGIQRGPVLLTLAGDSMIGMVLTYITHT